MAPSLRRKSGVSTSTVVPGLIARMARMVCGEMLRPAIGQVVAVHRRDHHMLEAQLLHRLRRHWPARRRRARPGKPVFTLQKAQARVQVSPMIIMVACALVQHSPIFGTGRFLADGVQIVLAHHVAGGGIFAATPAP